MGGAQSKNNDDLVDILVNHQQIKSVDIERVFRLVDRGRYFPEEYREDAYRDSPFKVPESDDDQWQPGRLHLSAPSMYAQVVDKLELRPGLSFLNVGSGSGWLNTVVGFLLGNNGINHGIEVHKNLVDYANVRLRETMNSPEVSAFPFSIPVFFHGNALSQDIPNSTCTRYDRIYCGAAINDQKTVNKVVRFLEIGGRLVTPMNGTLMCYIRTSEKRYLSQRVMNCQFADLLSSRPEDDSHVLSPIIRPLSLQHLCRSAIRSFIRRNVRDQCPILMRSLCTDGSSMPSNFTGPHIVYIHNPDAQGHVRVNVVAGDEHPGGFRMFQNMARVRVVVPNLPNDHFIPFRVAENADLVADEDAPHDVHPADGGRLDMHELPEDGAEEEVPLPRALPLRRRFFVDDDEEEDEVRADRGPALQIRGGEERNVEEVPEGIIFPRHEGGDEALADVALRQLHEALAPFPDEGDVVNEEEENNNDHDNEDDDNDNPDQEAEDSEGSSGIEEIAEVAEPPRDEDAERDIRRIELRRLIMRRGEDVARRELPRFLAGRYRRRARQEEQEEEEEGSVNNAAGEEDETMDVDRGENSNTPKRRRVEPEESKADRAYRVQRESMKKFNDLFHEKINAIQPLPVPLTRYLNFGI